MIRYEYKVCPAPTKGRKAPGVKGAEAKFAHGLEALMNEMGADGWDYLRSDILPSEERQGLTSSHTVYRSVLVFRRPVQDDASEISATPLAEDMVDEAADQPHEIHNTVKHPPENDPVETEADLPDDAVNPEDGPTEPRPN